MALNTSSLAHLLINRAPEQLELPWATVEVVSPVIMVRMATGPALPVTSNAAGPLEVGDRVWCVWHKRALTICASPSQAARIQSLVSGMRDALSSLTGRVGALEGRVRALGTFYAGTVTVPVSNDAYGQVAISLPQGRFTNQARMAVVGNATNYDARYVVRTYVNSTSSVSIGVRHVEGTATTDNIPVQFIVAQTDA